jgi:hypothetical protein
MKNEQVTRKSERGYCIPFDTYVLEASGGRRLNTTF